MRGTWLTRPQMLNAHSVLLLGMGAICDACRLFVWPETNDTGISKRLAPKRLDMPPGQFGRKVAFDVVVVHRDFANLLFKRFEVTLVILLRLCLCHFQVLVLRNQLAAKPVAIAKEHGMQLKFVAERF